MSKPIVLQPQLVMVRPQYTPNIDTGDHMENVLWFKSASAGTPTLANLTAMAAVFDPLWKALWATVGCAGSGDAGAYVGSIWTDMSTVFGLTYSSVGSVTVVAGSQGIPLTTNTSVLISLHIAERWRGGHARIYLPWVGEGCQDTVDYNKVKGTVIGACGSAFAAINAGTTGSGVLGGQTQQVYRNRTDPATAHLMPISSFTVQSMFATQRRRLRKAPHH